MTNRKMVEDGFPVVDKWIAKEGAQAGALILVEVDKEKGGTSTKKYWKCKCLACGRDDLISKREDNLKLGAIGGKLYSSGRYCAGTRSCGCKQKKSFKKPNVSGTQVTKYIEETYSGSKILYRTNYLDMNNRSTIVMCECQFCGKPYPTTTRSCAKGCGCTSGKTTPSTLEDYIDKKHCKSLAEETVYKLLTSINIPFEQEKKFLACCDINPLPFDFYLESPKYGKYVIETDGEQHFKEVKFFGDLSKRRAHDLKKNRYCWDNNIKVIRIPYDAEIKLNDLSLVTTRFLLTPENEKKYYESRA